MKRLLCVLLILIILVSEISVSAYSDEAIAEKRYERGLECFEKQDYEQAFSYFLIAGEVKGYAPAQNMLGICYRDGLGTEKDLDEAEKWFRSAAEQGNAEAIENISVGDREKEDAYQAAVDLYFQGEYVASKAAFEALGDYERSTDFIQMCNRLIQEQKETERIQKDVEVGDLLEFGNYEQDNDLTNGKEPVEWIVLDVDDGKALLVSKNGLFVKQYNSEFKDITWETCSLRKSLNGPFITAAFNIEERAAIQPVILNADDNPVYGTDAGNNTNDYVFLLSISEANKYFLSDSARKCIYTPYSNAKEEYGWWLRSPGHFPSLVACVNKDGAVDSDGNRADYRIRVVRPALWIDLDTYKNLQNLDNNNGIKFDMEGISVGQQIIFGSYEQDNYLNNGKEPIEWLVLDVQDNRALIVSKYLLDYQAYSSVWGNAVWKTSALRKWLNEIFITEAFTPAEQSKIPIVTVSSDEDSSQSKNTGNNTNDQIFLLSILEVKEYFSSDADRLSTYTAYAEALGCESSSWYMRSTEEGHPTAVSERSDVYNLIYPTARRAIRPALWVNMEP